MSKEFKSGHFALANALHLKYQYYINLILQNNYIIQFAIKWEFLFLPTI